MLGAVIKQNNNEEEHIMKRASLVSHVMLISIVLAGCVAASKTIAINSQSVRTDVFQEISGTESVPPGYADLMIRANIKTHVDGYYIGEPKESAHGKEFYPFLINIDGQAVLWKVQGKRHELPKYVDGITSRDPEAGTGMKYELEKKVRLAAGTHKVFLGLSEEPYHTSADISMESGGTYVLEFKPKYWHKRLPTRIPTFLKGINKYDILMMKL